MSTLRLQIGKAVRRLRTAAGYSQEGWAWGGEIPIQLTGPEEVVDQAPTDAGLVRNRGLRGPLFQQVFEHHEFVPSVHPTLVSVLAR